MARYKQMVCMPNCTDWKVRQKDGIIGRYARMRWGGAYRPGERRMPGGRRGATDEQDAWEIDKALRLIALPTELRATVECYHLDRRSTERRSWSAW